MKLKILRKKIRRLEARLQKGPKKLAKLKRKLGAITAVNARKASRKSAARARGGRQTVKSSTAIKKKKGDAKRPGVAKKVKRKLNLTPERRAQLAAAMKARWAAKRAAVGANPQDTSTGQDFSLGEVPHSPPQT
jgi:hypothetical protein